MARLFKTSYRADAEIWQGSLAKVFLITLVILLLLIPFSLGPYPLYIINLTGIAIIGALGLNLLVGYTGQISIGHAAFLAIGAYTSVILTTKLQIPFLLALPLGGIASASIGLIVGIPALRLKGLYLAIATFAFSFIVEHVISRWNSLTGGAYGIAIPRPAIGNLTIKTDRGYYFLIMAAVILAIYFATNLSRTKIGRGLGAVRDRDIAAEAIGIPIGRYKVLAFFISSFYAGIAGGLGAYYMSFISPEHFGIIVSIEYLSMIIVGGLGSIEGSIFGAILITILPEILRLFSNFVGEFYPVLVTRFADLKTILYGSIIVLFLVFEPDGLYGIWQDIKKYWEDWPFTY